MEAKASVFRRDPDERGKFEILVLRYVWDHDNNPATPPVPFIEDAALDAELREAEELWAQAGVKLLWDIKDVVLPSGWLQAEAQAPFWKSVDVLKFADLFTHILDETIQEQPTNSMSLTVAYVPIPRELGGRALIETQIMQAVVALNTLDNTQGIEWAEQFRNKIGDRGIAIVNPFAAANANLSWPLASRTAHELHHVFHNRRDTTAENSTLHYFTVAGLPLIPSGDNLPDVRYRRRIPVETLYDGYSWDDWNP